jgi:type II secretory pathway pseudopilin PulG
MVELLVATGLLLVVSAIVTSALTQMRQSQRTISNRTAMHSGIRGATELLQQEVGQAGLVSLPATPTLSANVVGTICDATNPLTNSVPVNVSSSTGMFAGMALTTLDGDASETVSVVSVSAGSFSACFQGAHASGTKIAPLGGFATGIVPPTGIANGSSGYVLKLYGDVNGDGNMVYVEYTCDLASRNLYRNMMPFDAPSKSAYPLTDGQILLSNVVANPDGSPCFTYQTAPVSINGTTFTFVLDVAITLTVETEQVDPITGGRQQETKALLNVSPRNVFDAWAYASMGYTFRIQSTPVSVTSLLPTS